MKKFLLSLVLMSFLLPFTVIAQDEVFVGDAINSKNVAPFLNSYPHSWLEMIYQKDEIGQSYSISEIAFQYVRGPQLQTNEINIYLAETTKTKFEDKTQWTAEDELTLVYSGKNILLGEEEWETFKLDTTFEYSGEKNLAVVVSKTANRNELMLEWACFYGDKSVMFTASDTDPTFAQYPADTGLATYTLKPIMRLSNIAAVPDAPVVKLEEISDTEIKLTWNAVETATTYTVYKGIFAYKTEMTDTTLVVSDIDPEVENCFSVSAFNRVGESPRSEEVCVNSSNEGIAEMTTSLNIYPNPAGDEIRVSSEEMIEEVVVYDVYGRLQVTETPSHQDEMTVDVSDLNSGVYFVKVKFGSDEVVRRILKL